VSDDFQGRGLGSELIAQLINIARQEKIARITADILGENRTMQRVCERLGFQLKYDPDDDTVKVTMHPAQ
jgi:acetyltransferase